MGFNKESSMIVKLNIIIIKSLEVLRKIGLERGLLITWIE